MKILKPLFFVFAMLYGSSYCGAQEIDSVHVDTTSFPGPTYVRIKFPHDGFRLTNYVQRDFNCYPPIIAINFVFKECTGTPGITYYDTTLGLWVYPPTALYMRVFLDANTWDTTCVLRPSDLIVDTFLNLYGSVPTAVQNREMGSVGVYPNPVINHRLMIETDASVSRPTMATFYSLQGNRVATYMLSEAKTEIALPPHLPAGNYLLLLRMEDGAILRKRIIVQ